MKLVHGSPFHITNDQPFVLFDYTLDLNQSAPSHLNNGNDSFGPGIYTFPASPAHYADSVKAAACYTRRDDAKPEDQGYIYVLSVDVKESELLNKRDPDEISLETWIAVIERFMMIRRTHEHYDEDLFLEFLQPYTDTLDSNVKINYEALERILQNKYEIHLEFNNPDRYVGNGCQWSDLLLEDYRINKDPCGYIFEEGGPEAIANHAIESSDNLWEVIVSIWEKCAVSNHGQNTYNQSFLQAIKYFATDDDKLIAAKVSDNSIVVVFDPSEISIIKTIEMSQRQSLEKSI